MITIGVPIITQTESRLTRMLSIYAPASRVGTGDRSAAVSRSGIDRPPPKSWGPPSGLEIARAICIARRERQPLREARERRSASVLMLRSGN